MAGAGYKLFNTGDVLTAAQVNTYLMEQTVMVFADAAARTTALTGVVSEGMISYLKDTNAVEVYNGSAWVSSDDPNAIQNTIVDAKGDLITATGSDVPARLAVGNNGDTLLADSSATTGLRWSGANQRNPIINSGFDIWQRGTSFTGSNTYIYTADRWAWRDTSGGSNSLGQVTTSLPTGFSYALRFGRANAATTTSAQRFGTAIETIDSIPYADKTVTLSFYAKKGANFSPTGVSVYLVSGTGTNQAINGTTGGWDSYTGVAYPIDQTLSSSTLTTSWVRYSYTGTVASTATELAIYFASSGVGTAGADDYFYLTGLQLDIGSVALPYRRAGGTLQGELAAAQRYYQRVYGNGVSSGLGAGLVDTTTQAQIKFPFKVTMRTNPTALETSGTTSDYIVKTGGAVTTVSVVPTFTAATTEEIVTTWTVASGLTVGQAAFGRSGASTAYLGWSAEL
jgi:hypothetical protein